jgi:hypothetical protein
MAIKVRVLAAVMINCIHLCCQIFKNICQKAPQSNAGLVRQKKAEEDATFA